MNSKSKPKKYQKINLFKQSIFECQKNFKSTMAVNFFKLKNKNVAKGNGLKPK